MSHLMNQPLTDKAIVACPNCDLLQRLPEVAPGESIRCSRCDTEFGKTRFHQPHAGAGAAAAVVLWIITNTMPMACPPPARRSPLLSTPVRNCFEHGQPLVAGVIFFTVVLAPVLQISSSCSSRMGRIGSNRRSG